jgi:hypothetical protein
MITRIVKNFDQREWEYGLKPERIYRDKIREQISSFLSSPDVKLNKELERALSDVVSYIMRELVSPGLHRIAEKSIYIELIEMWQTCAGFSGRGATKLRIDEMDKYLNQKFNSDYGNPEFEKLYPSIKDCLSDKTSKLILNNGEKVKIIFD